MRGKPRSWTDEQFIAAVARHTNFTDVIRELGLRAAGGNHRTVKIHARRLGVNTTHFNTERRLRGINVTRQAQTRRPEEVFCVNSPVTSRVLRLHALKHLREPQCAICGIGSAWNGKPLTLQLHHMNGVHNDNRRENLTWLCPNCHSQTDTFAGRRRHDAILSARVVTAD